MTARLLVVASAAPVDRPQLVFGDADALAPPDLPRLSGRTAGWWCGPEPAGAATARALGGEPQVLAGLAGPDFGRWTGCALAEVEAAEPGALRLWLSEVTAAPHGGESLAALVARVGAETDRHPWPDGRSVLVVAPLVVRALAVHALGAPAAVLLRLDVAPLDRLVLTRGPGGWRLRP